jgi:hypothetical protein
MLTAVNDAFDIRGAQLRLPGGRRSSQLFILGEAEKRGITGWVWRRLGAIS